MSKFSEREIPTRNLEPRTLNPKRNKPELLAPAGNLLSAVVALDSGADAVYIGLDKFNARERADNFTISDASKLINYAHSNGKKVYITLNTLIKESELDQIAEMLADITELDPDAVIVQDLGIVYLIREMFPALKIHASTQMAIHNSAGIKIAREMGIERVILERQVMDSELKKIMRKSKIEVEVFVQGALCCSLSGRCLFSSWLGAWSGNRGKCTQPCRRRFFSENGNGFFFSTKDLVTLKTIPKLVQMGISSFKIEGRLKKPDYIKNVVTAYRQLIDAPKEQQSIAISEAGKILSRIAGRQSSEGFATEQALQQLIEPKKMGVTGIYCGKVISTAKKGFKAEVTKKIHIGDILRLQQYAGDDSSALSVSSITIDGKPVNKALKGDICFIKCERLIPENASIYKTGESYARIPAKLASLPTQKQKIPLHIKITSEGFSVLSHFAEWKKSMNIEKADKHPLSEAKIIEAFSATNSDFLDAGAIQVEINGNLFIPASVLKQTRRECWTYLEEKYPKDTAAKNRQKLIENYKDHIEKLHLDAVLAKQQFNPKIASKTTKCGQEAMDLYVFDGKAPEVIIPPFCPENKLEEVSGKMQEIFRKNPKIKFRVTSLYAFELLKQLPSPPTIIMSFPFPVCNSLAICEIRKLSQESEIETIQAWVELEKNEICNLLENSPIPIEMFVEGQVPLMATRAQIPASGVVHDDRGAAYFIEKDDSFDITYVFSEKSLKIPPIPNIATFATCTHFLTGKKETTFNFNRELV